MSRLLIRIEDNSGLFPAHRVKNGFGASLVGKRLVGPLRRGSGVSVEAVGLLYPHKAFFGEGESSLMLTVFIVNDEALALENLRYLLAQDNHLEVVEECANAVGSHRRYSSTASRCRVLDTQMPRISGLEVVVMIDPDSMSIYRVYHGMQ